MLCREHDGNEEEKGMGRTWNRDMTPSERLLALYSMLLFSGRTVSLTELSRELACSKQTVRRLVDQLEASPFGRILRSMHGREVMYRMERPAVLPKISLDPEGLQQLALCRAFLCHLLPETMQRTMEAALQQASAYLPAGEMLGDAEEIGRALAKGPIDYAPFQQDLQTLIDAIGRRRVCVVTYRAVSGSGEKRHFFAPQKLLAYHESLYVHGWMVSEKGRAEPLYDSPTNLALHRMTSVRMTRRSCEGVGREEDDTEGCFGLMGCRPFTVRVRFAASSAAYASEHGEMAQYNRSYQANSACKEAIEQTISAHYAENRLDTEAAVKDVLEKFGTERVQFILANTIQHKNHDGRISQDNKAWAKTIPMLEDSGASRHCAYLVVDQVNPGLTDLFTRQFRKVAQEQQKSSVLQKLKQEPPARKPATPKKREPER